MKKRVSKLLLMLIAVMLVAGTFSTAAFAKGPKWDDHPGKGLKHEMKKEWKLKDINEHWAKQTVEKMSLLGIIKGYEDMTFQPNKPVTHAEAVVMTIRLLKMEEEAEDYLDTDLAYRDESSIPLWAKGHVALALEEGILESSNVFQANKPATRLYVMMLLVNAIGAEFEGDWSEARDHFSDTDSLNEEERAYVAYASLIELVKGYEDNTFRPNKPVTRAEMAALVSRVLDQKEDVIDYNNKIEGTIVSVDADDNEISVIQEVYADGDDRNVTFEYVLSEDVEIYIDGKEEDIEDLQEGMYIEFILNGDEIVYLEAESEEEQVEENELLVNFNDDVREFKVEMEGNDLELQYEVKIEDDRSQFEAKVEIDMDSSKTEIKGELALEQIVDMLEELDIDSLSYDNVNGEEIVEYLVEEYNIDSYTEAKVELKSNQQDYKWEIDDDDEDDEDEDD